MPPDKRAPRGNDVLDWFTISYRAIYVVAAVLIVAGAGAYFYLTRPGDKWTGTLHIDEVGWR